MKCAVAYVSRSGNTAAVAKEVANILSKEEIQLTDLSCEVPPEDADVYLIGFGVNQGTIPLKVMDAMELAEGKVLLMFATCGMEPTEYYKETVERKVTPFLPENCDYRGVFLCPGQFQEDVISKVEEILQAQPDNSAMRLIWKTPGRLRDIQTAEILRN